MSLKRAELVSLSVCRGVVAGAGFRKSIVTLVICCNTALCFLVLVFLLNVGVASYAISDPIDVNDADTNNGGKMEPDLTLDRILEKDQSGAPCCVYKVLGFLNDHLQVMRPEENESFVARFYGNEKNAMEGFRTTVEELYKHKVVSSPVTVHTQANGVVTFSSEELATLIGQFYRSKQRQEELPDICSLGMPGPEQVLCFLAGVYTRYGVHGSNIIQLSVKNPAPVVRALRMAGCKRVRSITEEDTVPQSTEIVFMPSEEVRKHLHIGNIVDIVLEASSVAATQEHAGPSVWRFSDRRDNGGEDLHSTVSPPPNPHQTEQDKDKQ